MQDIIAKCVLIQLYFPHFNTKVEYKEDIMAQKVKKQKGLINLIPNRCIRKFLNGVIQNLSMFSSARIRRNFIEPNCSGYPGRRMSVLGLPSQHAESFDHPGVPQRGLEHALQNHQLGHQSIPASAHARSRSGTKTK